MADYVILTDEELFMMLKKGDHKAFSAIYNRYWQGLYLYSCKLLQDEDASKDVIQDIFTNLWQLAPTLTIRISLKAYLYTAVRFNVTRLLSKGKLREEFAASLVKAAQEGTRVTEDEINFREFERIIEKGINQLPPRMRLMFEKSRSEGLSHKAIALELDVKENTVKTTIFRAMTILRSHLPTWTTIAIIGYQLLS